MLTDAESNEIVRFELDQTKVELLKRTICKGSTDDELALFVHVCRRTGLDPFMRQVYAIKRWDAESRRESVVFQTGIDGYRLIAERTERYMPGREPTFEYVDGKLLKATAYIQKLDKLGKWHEVSSSAFYDEYVGTKKDGTPNTFWKNKPHVMLSKVAEALALRKAFPADLSGVYTAEEMGTEEPAQDDTTKSKVPEKVVEANDLSDDNLFFSEWDRLAAARDVCSVESARNFLMTAMNHSRHKSDSMKSSWRRDVLDSLNKGNFDSHLRPKPPEPTKPEPPKPSADELAHTARIAAAKKALEEAESAARAPKPPEPEGDADLGEPTEDDLQLDFWGNLTDVSGKQVEQIRAAVDRFASGMKKTGDSLPPQQKLRVYRAMRSGIFNFTSCRIEEPPQESESPF